MSFLKRTFFKKSSFFVQLEAMAALIGTIIGAGVFALPKTAVVSGLFFTFIWLGIVLFLIIYLHLAYGEIVLRTAKEFRLPGYAGYYLGEPARRFMLLTTFLTFSFSLLIYLFLGGQFIQTLLSVVFPSTLFPLSFFVIFLWLLLSVLLLGKQDKVSRFNLVLSLFLFILFILIALKSLPSFHLSHLIWWQNNHHFNWLLPYGVLFYALNGMVAVPEVISLLKRKRINLEKTKRIIIQGISLSAFCYLLFIISVMGVTGMKTTPEAINGLKNILGKEIVILGASLGLLAVVTSYLIFALYIRNSFLYDFRWSPFISNLVVITGPLILYFCHFLNLIQLISFLGGVLGGFEGLMVLFTLSQAKKKSDLTPSYEVPLNKIVFIIMFMALITGALLQIFLVS